MPGFVEIARDKFAFLESSYGYEIQDEKENNDGGQIVYINTHVGVGVKLVYEFSNAFIFIFICRLVDGELHDNPTPIKNDSKINCFDFNDYLESDLKMRPAYDYQADKVDYFDEQNGLRNYTSEFALRLKKYGTKILEGDLSMLPSIELIIKERAKHANCPEW